MLLTRLMELKERLEDKLAPAYYKKNEIDWVIELDDEGNYQGIIKTSDQDEPFEHYVPYRKRSGRKPPPYFLVDKPGYVLNLDLDDRGEEKVQERHDMYFDLLKEATSELENTSLNAINTFLETLPNSDIEDVKEDMKSGDRIAFKVDGQWPFNEPELKNFWIEYQTHEQDEKSLDKGTIKEAECIICGEHRPVAVTHPAEIKIGPERTGLITANESAFLSFGFKQSEIAPTCNRCALEYGRVLTYLVNSPDHTYKTGDALFVFWVLGENNFNPFDFIDDPDPEDVERLLKAPFRDQEPGKFENERFVLFSVSANKSRLVVRNHLEATLGDITDNLEAYFKRQRIVSNDGAVKPLGIYSLLGGMVQNFQDVPPGLVEKLVVSALFNRNLPVSILYRVIQRVKADTDHRVTRPRAALFKMILNQSEEVSEVSEQLDDSIQDPAYLCGRLFAVIEQVQYSALPGIQSTIGDRFYGTASTAPGSVFGTLIRKAQTAYLPKLRKNREGAYHALSKQLEDILSRVPDFPSTLNMKEQGLFGLGYYQQKADDRASRTAAIEASKVE